MDLVLSLVTEGEREELGLSWLKCVRLPIEDRGVPPDRAAVGRVVRLMREQLLEGARVLVHCRAGIGRSGLVAGCVMAELGMRPAAAILERLSTVRGVEVPDTVEQAEWLAAYVALLDAPPSLDEAFRRHLG